MRCLAAPSSQRLLHCRRISSGITWFQGKHSIGSALCSCSFKLHYFFSQIPPQSDSPLYRPNHTLQKMVKFFLHQMAYLYHSPSSLSLDSSDKSDTPTPQLHRQRRRLLNSQNQIVLRQPQVLFKRKKRLEQLVETLSRSTASSDRTFIELLNMQIREHQMQRELQLRVTQGYSSSVSTEDSWTTMSPINSPTGASNYHGGGNESLTHKVIPFCPSLLPYGDGGIANSFLEYSRVM